MKIIILGCRSEKRLPPFFWKLCILTYFDVLIMKMIVKVGANLIFMVKIIKNL